MRKIKKLFKKYKYNYNKRRFAIEQRVIQDSYNLNDLINAKKISVFFIPQNENIGGGTMSIFNF